MKALLIIFSLFTFSFLNAQVKEYVGKWELCKVITSKGDTQLVKSSDPRFVSYNFDYNNTFTSFIKEKNEEATGRWGFDFKTKTIKIKYAMLSTTRVAMGDVDIAINKVMPNYFVEIKTEK